MADNCRLQGVEEGERGWGFAIEDGGDGRRRSRGRGYAGSRSLMLWRGQWSKLRLEAGYGVNHGIKEGKMSC